ncbi:MAG: hypothetical protein M3R31_08615 [Pseudomonadota bacterium]|nr:hypothetical protein [Pseudomonadota bacterium]
MGIKKVLSETAHSLVAHWITNGLLFLGTIAVPYWGLISANWSWPGAIVAGMIFLAAGVILRDRFLFSNKSLETSNSTALTNESSWLEQLADKDDKEMSNRIRPIHESAYNEPHLDAPNPYIDLRLAFINASVFTLAPVRADGRFRLRGYDLQAMAELFQKQPIGHAEYGSIVIRQWLTPDAAKEISTNRPVSLETGNVAVWFGYTNAKGENKEARSSIGNDMLNIQ